jgi:hypothetical protein
LFIGVWLPCAWAAGTLLAAELAADAGCREPGVIAVAVAGFVLSVLLAFGGWDIGVRVSEQAPQVTMGLRPGDERVKKVTFLTVGPAPDDAMRSRRTEVAACIAEATARPVAMADLEGVSSTKLGVQIAKLARAEAPLTPTEALVALTDRPTPLLRLSLDQPNTDLAASLSAWYREHEADKKKD